MCEPIGKDDKTLATDFVENYEHDEKIGETQEGQQEQAMDLELDLDQQIDQLIPPDLGAMEKVGKIDQLLKKNASIKISKGLKRRLQNRRSALKSRMRKT